MGALSFVENPLHHWQFGCGTSEVLLTIMSHQRWEVGQEVEVERSDTSKKRAAEE